MIKISDDLYVAAEQIAEVGLSSRRDMIFIRMKSGDNHSYYVPFGVSAFTSLDQLAKQIDEELKQS